MAFYRVSFMFYMRASRIAGWSENFWYQAESAADAMTNALALAPRLNECHGFGSVMTNVRVVNVANRRDGFIRDYGFVDTNNDVAQSVTSDYPTTAMLFSMNSVQGGTTRQTLRGIPDDIVTRGRFTNAAGWFNAFQSLAGALAGTGSGWRIRILADNPKKEITLLNPLTGVVTAAAHGYVENDRVRVSSVRGTNGGYVNRIWRVANPTANTFELVGWNPPSTFNPDISNAYSRLQSFVFHSISNVNYIRISRRNVGRPFALLTGRRRRRSY